MMTLSHTDVVCPPDPAAVCRCGAELRAHAPTDETFYGRRLDLLQCPEPEPTVDRLGVVPAYFDLAAGQSLDCPHVLVDEVCGVTVCSEHSAQFVTCAGSFALHHWDCRDHCDACTVAAQTDARNGDL